MPFCYFYHKDAKTAYDQRDELISCGFEAGVMFWDDTGNVMVSFEIR